MYEDETVPLKLKDTVRAVMMLEDAIDVLIASTNMFIKQKDAHNKTGNYESLEGKAALKRVEDGLNVLKSKIVCRQIFLKDFKERINNTGIDIDAEIEKYKKNMAGD